MSRAFPFFRIGWSWSFVITLALAALLGGCASAPQPVLDADLEAFSAGVGGVLQPGMTMREARAALRERFPPPSIVTQAAAPVSRGGDGFPARRYLLGWPTMDPSTTLMVTIYCDRQGRILHWTTGPLLEPR